MTLRRLLKQKPALLAGALLMVAGAATLYFPETWYPEETQWQLATEKDIPGIQGGLLRPDGTRTAERCLP